jgi:hypothetical protein
VPICGGARRRSQELRRRVTFDGIGRVLAFVRQTQGITDLGSIEIPVSVEEKCAHNLLSRAATEFLRLGLQSESRVGEYLTRQVEPTEADDMAESFKGRYRALRAEEMIIYAGSITGDLEHDAAALSVVAYFFVTCDIFERPRLRECVS